MTQVIINRNRSTIARRREALRAYSIILPFYIWFFIFIPLPLLFGFGISFFDFEALGKPPEWVGLKNFITFFSSRDYLTLLLRQIWIGGLCMSTNMITSFFLALLLNSTFKMRAFFRTAYYIPGVTAVSATTAIYVALLNPYDGGLNKFFLSIGKEPIIWAHSAFWMVFWIVVYGLWRSVGATAVFWLGGLQSISPSLYEAARIDGANRVQEIRYITIPGLRNIGAFIFLTQMIGAMQMYDVIMLISRGGPVGKTDVLMYRIFRDGIISFNMGMAGASSLVLGSLTLIFAFIYFKLSAKGVEQ